MLLVAPQYFLILVGCSIFNQSDLTWFFNLQFHTRLNVHEGKGKTSVHLESPFDTNLPGSSSLSYIVAAPEIDGCIL